MAGVKMGFWEWRLAANESNSDVIHAYDIANQSMACNSNVGLISGVEISTDRTACPECLRLVTASMEDEPRIIVYPRGNQIVVGCDCGVLLAEWNLPRTPAEIAAVADKHVCPS